MNRTTGKDMEQTAVDIYFAFRRHHGALVLTSGYMGRGDSTKLSRQLNPGDERRDNPFIGALEILRAAARFAPELENEVWTMLEARRAEWAGCGTVPAESLSRLIHTVGDELNDVVEAVIDRAAMPEVYKEVVELEAVIGRLKNKCAAAVRESGKVHGDRMKELVFDIPTVSEANRASHEHWRVRQKRAKAQREVFSLIWRSSRVKVRVPAVVTFTRCAARKLDSDNLPTAFKHVRDQLAEEIGIDDRDERVEWRYEQRFESKANRFTVRIEKKAADRDR